MSLKKKIAFYCYFSVAIFAVGMSLVYILSPQIMPYHLEVVGMPWEKITPGFQLMLLTFMKVGGAIALASSLSFIFMLWIPFRRGERWALWAIPISQFPSLIGLNYGPFNIALRTSAHPPLFIRWILEKATKGAMRAAGRVIREPSRQDLTRSR
jgi:hypothetical protein